MGEEIKAGRVTNGIFYTTVFAEGLCGLGKVDYQKLRQPLIVAFSVVYESFINRR